MDSNGTCNAENISTSWRYYDMYMQGADRGIRARYYQEAIRKAMHTRRWTGLALIQVMVYRMFDAKPLPEPVMTYYYYYC